MNSQKLVNPKCFLHFNFISYALLVSVLIFKLRWTLAEDYYFTVWSAANKEKERFYQMKHSFFLLLPFFFVQEEMKRNALRDENSQWS